MSRPDWDDYFLGIAKAVSARADCRRALVGAVIVDKEKRIVSTGYNGSWPGGPSCLAGQCPRGLLSDSQLAPLSPDYSSCVALHAEQNAIAWADRSRTSGATLYISSGGLECCDMCKKLVKAAGIERVVVDINESTR